MATVPEPMPHPRNDYPTASRTPMPETDWHRDLMVLLIGVLRLFRRAARVRLGQPAALLPAGQSAAARFPRRLRGSRRGRPSAAQLPPVGRRGRAAGRDRTDLADHAPLRPGAEVRAVPERARACANTSCSTRTAITSLRSCRAIACAREPTVASAPCTADLPARCWDWTSNATVTRCGCGTRPRRRGCRRRPNASSRSSRRGNWPNRRNSRLNRRDSRPNRRDSRPSRRGSKKLRRGSRPNSALRRWPRKWSVCAARRHRPPRRIDRIGPLPRLPD